MPSVREVKALQPPGRSPYQIDRGEIWWEGRHEVIFRAQRKPDGLPVLLKLLREPATADPRADWLLREYQIALLLHAKSAVKPFAFEWTVWGPALVYGDEGARPLEEVAAKAPLDIETVLTLGASIAEAVGALHKDRLIHGNLNPGTIWLNPETRAVMVSGLSCARYRSEELTVPLPPTDELADIRYISPEQTGRLQRSVDQRADIYSLGIILFQLLIGKVPFAGTNPLHIMDGHLTRQPQFPGRLHGHSTAGLEKVVLKALAKSPEARYHTASGLAADLLECRSLWRSTGAVEEFEPGRHDLKGILAVSRRLYGRERATGILLEKARAAGLGRPTMLLVNGPPGVGKSTLLDQLRDFVRGQNGRFVSGKCDQYRRNVPYLALVQAFQQLIRQLLSETDGEIQEWRSRILAALGNAGRVAADVIPELELITGPLPSVPILPPTQERNRFNRVFTNLIQAIAARDQLLCVVIDDLQWIDAASLGLLTKVLLDPGTKNILLAGAYRDGETDPSRSLEQRFGALQGSGVDVHVLHLRELEQRNVLELIRDTFNVSSDEAGDLARVLHSRTGGNPFHVTQLLHFLCDEGLIAFDYATGKWIWDLQHIRREGVTEDVVSLLNNRLVTMHEATRMILATAACIGTSFEIGVVATAAGHSLSEVMQCMTIGVKEGLIIAEEGATFVIESPSGENPRIRFRFLHDQIQQAAFDYVLDNAKKNFRLQVGRRLMAALQAEDALVSELDVLSNTNYAWQLLEDEGERQCAACLNLSAGRRARQALAYQDALGYISVGLGLIGEKGWQTSYELAAELHFEALECEYLLGHFDRADHLFTILFANARSKLETARTYHTKMLLETSEEHHEEALKVGLKALKLFNLSYARSPSRLHLLLELMLARLRVRGRKSQCLNHIKSIEDPEQIAALRILVALLPTAYFLSPALLLYTGLKIVNLSLRRGISPLAAAGFALYGLGLSMDDQIRGYDFGRFALELAEKSNDPTIICKVLVIFAHFLKFWRDPVDESLPMLDRARKMALEVGDYQFANFAALGKIAMRFSRGCSLNELLRDCEEQRPFIAYSKDAFADEALTMWENFALALQGKTNAPHSLSDGDYDEVASELRYHRTGNFVLVSLHHTRRLQLAYLFGRYNDALVLSQKSEAVIRYATGTMTLVEHYFYTGLALAAASQHSFNPLFASHRRNLQRCLARLRRFSANSPQNFQQYEALLEAEIAWLRGQEASALKFYNDAIELAEAQGFVQIVALANERAALCCIAHGQRRLAIWYLGCARAAYERWGASAKTDQLDREFANLLPDLESPSVAMKLVHDDRSHHRQEGNFDLTAALHASRIIANEEDADGILTNLMHIIRIQAGAENAHLLILENGWLRVKASAGADGVMQFRSFSPDTCPAFFSPAIANYVMHTGDDVLLADADADPRFARCGYIREHHPKSVLCCGIMHQKELLGAIYLEHTQVSRAFNEQKLEWLRILTAEVGLTIRSGRLSCYRDYVHKFAPTAVSKEIDANPGNPDLALRDCDISILFADLAGYTRMAELMERSELNELINRAFSRCVEEIQRYDGVLLEVTGDELFAMFRGEDRTRHTWRAASAALAIARAATCLNEESSGFHPPLVMNMGINSGIASVGLRSIDTSSGSAWRYGASGSVVNIAARVREIALNGSIMVTADAAARVSSDFVLDDMGEHKLKNVTRPVRLYSLLGERRG